MKTVVLLSGGLDSTVLAAQLKSEGHEVICLSILYGQKHEIELEAAKLVAEALSLEHVICEADEALSPIFAGAPSSQVGEQLDVPHGHYADESMKTTLVPNRNMILLSIAAGLAVSRKAEAIAYAAHAGDHAIYPDCRPEFAATIARAILLGTPDVILLAPFVGISKTEIAKLGASLNVPMNLSYSCYEGGEYHCGKCGTCVERKEAFREAGVEDPTAYAEEASVE